MNPQQKQKLLNTQCCALSVGSFWGIDAPSRICSDPLFPFPGVNKPCKTVWRWKKSGFNAKSMMSPLRIHYDLLRQLADFGEAL